MQCKWSAYGPSDAITTPLSNLPFWCWLIQAVLEKRPLNGSLLLHQSMPSLPAVYKCRSTFCRMFFYFMLHAADKFQEVLTVIRDSVIGPCSILQLAYQPSFLLCTQTYTVPHTQKPLLLLFLLLSFLPTQNAMLTWILAMGLCLCVCQNVIHWYCIKKAAQIELVYLTPCLQ